MKGCEKETYQQIQEETFISNKIEVNMKTNKRDKYFTLTEQFTMNI